MKKAAVTALAFNFMVAVDEPLNKQMFGRIF